MKRSTIALAVCMGLSACSGQRNENTNTLGAGKRDAATDAEQGDDEDAEVRGEDASEPERDAGGGGERDGGMQGADGGGGEGDARVADASLDAGPVSDTGAASDAGVASDTGAVSDTGSNNPTQLRIKLNYETQFSVLAPIFFSYADGGVESMRQTDNTGLLVSDTAPAMFTAVLPGTNGTLDEHSDIITVVAPALGDFIVIDPFVGRQASDQAIRYLATIGSVPTGGYSVSAYAGVDGCSQGYQDLLPAPTSPMQIGQRPTCQLESNGSLIAVMYDEPGAVLRYAGAALPSAGDTPVAFTLDQWLVPEDFTLLLANGVPNATPEAHLWMRKGALKVQVNGPDNPPPTAFPYKVARSIIDSFDAEAWFARDSTKHAHQFRKNRPAAVANVTLDLNDALPEVDVPSVTISSTPLLQPSASWSVKDGPTPADAVVAAFTWGWQPNSDTTASLTWRLVAPPATASVTVPAAPTTGSFGLGPPVDADTTLVFEGVWYYESDAQSGYRDFLKEPLRPGVNRSEIGRNTPDLLRDLPVGATLRMGRYQR